MSTDSSKRPRSQDLMETVWILACIVIIGILMVSGYNTDLRHDSLRWSLGSQNHAYSDSSVGADFSFASDQRYWSANCSHGWSADSTCNAIMLRAQSCEIASTSTYCSSYKDYLLQFNNK